MLTVEAFKKDHRIQLLEKAKIKKITLWSITSTNKYYGNNFDIFCSGKALFSYQMLSF